MSAVLAESISSPVGLLIGFFCLLKKEMELYSCLVLINTSKYIGASFFKLSVHGCNGRDPKVPGWEVQGQGCRIHTWLGCAPEGALWEYIAHFNTVFFF